jgi:hypothetical protein
MLLLYNLYDVRFSPGRPTTLTQESYLRKIHNTYLLSNHDYLSTMYADVYLMKMRGFGSLKKNFLISLSFSIWQIQIFVNSDLYYLVT